MSVDRGRGVRHRVLQLRAGHTGDPGTDTIGTDHHRCGDVPRGHAGSFDRGTRDPPVVIAQEVHHGDAVHDLGTSRFGGLDQNRVEDRAARRV
jgi:hypothetical protein